MHHPRTGSRKTSTGAALSSLTFSFSRRFSAICVVGLALIIVPGSESTLSKRAVTTGELFKGAGYATAIFGKWNLGTEPQSLPTAHGSDEFYGIPPDISWDSATYVDTIMVTHSMDVPARCTAGEGTANRVRKAG